MLKLQDLIINNNMPTPDFVKYIDENNWAIAFKERDDAEIFWKSYVQHNNKILNLAQNLETCYWHVTNGEVT